MHTDLGRTTVVELSAEVVRVHEAEICSQREQRCQFSGSQLQEIVAVQVLLPVFHKLANSLETDH